MSCHARTVTSSSPYIPQRPVKNMENIDIEALTSDYVIPWRINIAMALAIFTVGRMVAGVIVRVLKNLLAKSGMDVHLDKGE